MSGWFGWFVPAVAAPVAAAGCVCVPPGGAGPAPPRFHLALRAAPAAPTAAPGAEEAAQGAAAAAATAGTAGTAAASPEGTAGTAAASPTAAAASREEEGEQDHDSPGVQPRYSGLCSEFSMLCCRVYLFLIYFSQRNMFLLCISHYLTLLSVRSYTEFFVKAFLKLTKDSLTLWQ